MRQHAPRRRRQRRFRLSRLLPSLLILLVCGGLFFRWSNRSLQVTEFDPQFTDLPAGFDGYRIVVLSDLHSTEFGPQNETLFSAVEAQQPDSIFLVGDLGDRFRGMEPSYAANVAAGLTAIAPTYYVTGNHEWALGDVRNLKATLTAHGVTVLSNEFLTLERNGDTLILAGIDDPNGFADQKSPETLASQIYAAHGDPFWILLAHRNDLFEPRYSLLGADLVVSGHAHGGMIRLPFTDGLISHDMTFFPSYTAGLYELNGSCLFATRGLGNSGPSFRLFNRPEVATLTLHKGE